MFSRRDLITGSVFGSMAAEPALLAQRGSVSVNADDIDQRLSDIRDALRAFGRVSLSAEIVQIRDRQRSHFKINQRFPNQIDIGLQVWERLYDWHLENHLPLAVARRDDGHMEMQVMMTTLVLRSDVGENFIGTPYDR
jgi:hypothetical protein